MLIGTVIVIITCLVFSAFFSGMEIAFTSANRLKVEIEKKKHPAFQRIIDIFLKDPGQYITTILVGNNVALVVYSLNMSLLLNLLFRVDSGAAGVVIETLVSTIIIIFVGEFMPKELVRGNPNFFMRALAVPIFILYIIFWPVARFTTWLSRLLLRLFGAKVGRSHTVQRFDRVELEHLVDEAADAEAADVETRLFQNAMEFRDVRVRDCMVPRVEVEAVEIDDSISALMARFVESKFSRIFIYKGTVDNIVGYVNTKSLFRQPATIADVLLEVDFVPESLPAQSVLGLMTRKNRAVAVVVDEFGGTAGIVSMEDVLEEIFGEIEDEHDTPDLVEKVQPDGTLVLSGRLEVDYLNEKYALGIPESEAYDTLAGWIIFMREGIPVQGDELELGGMPVKILRVDNSKLELVKIEVFHE